MKRGCIFFCLSLLVTPTFGQDYPHIPREVYTVPSNWFGEDTFLLETVNNSLAKDILASKKYIYKPGFGSGKNIPQKNEKIQEVIQVVGGETAFLEKLQGKRYQIQNMTNMEDVRIPEISLIGSEYRCSVPRISAIGEYNPFPLYNIHLGYRNCMYNSPERELVYNTFNIKHIRIHFDRAGEHTLRIYPIHPNEKYRFGGFGPGNENIVIFDPALGYDDIRIDGEKQDIHTGYEKKIYTFDDLDFTVTVWYPYYELEIETHDFELSYWSYTPDDTLRFALQENERILNMPFLHTPRDMSIMQDIYKLHTTDIYLSSEFIPSFETQDDQSRAFQKVFESEYPECIWEKGVPLSQECRKVQSQKWEEYFSLGIPTEKINGPMGYGREKHPLQSSLVERLGGKDKLSILTGKYWQPYTAQPYLQQPILSLVGGDISGEYMNTLNTKSYIITSPAQQKTLLRVYPFRPQYIPKYVSEIPPRVILFDKTVLWGNVRAGNTGHIAPVQYDTVHHEGVVEGKNFTTTILYPYYEIELDLKVGNNTFELTYFSYTPEIDEYFGIVIFG